PGSHVRSRYPATTLKYLVRYLTLAPRATRRHHAAGPRALPAAVARGRGVADRRLLRRRRPQAATPARRAEPGRRSREQALAGGELPCAGRAALSRGRCAGARAVGTA